MSLRSMNALHRRASGFLRRDENGGTNTIEFVLWLPIFIFVVCLVVDVCFLFLSQAIMFDVASDTARRAALGLFNGIDEAARNAAAEDFAADAATFLGVRPAVDASVDTNPVSIVITHDPSAIDLTGVFGFISGTEMTASVTQLREGLAAAE
ncbi:pilus assembly protein [Halovulum dunhuangense]|uniref:Pilus assembly protein n=1 Tax=Halovulum dunhuangense TaxID=1505036 RepID=A0A849KZ05_9RHOB|nr:TadE family protein [Halovulum dunhuangense]NNU79122.1 pilus assembly protein [Halovulum dunhuangense]